MDHAFVELCGLGIVPCRPGDRWGLCDRLVVCQCDFRRGGPFPQLFQILLMSLFAFG